MLRRVPQPGNAGTERSKLHDALVVHYEAEIFTGRLATEDRLPAEAEIARLFSVSTRTVRDALQVLETKGLVQRRHGECAVVVRNDVAGFLGSLALSVQQLLSTDPHYFLELMDIRRMVELDVVGRLAAPGETLNGEVQQALDGMDAAMRANNAAAFARQDAEFHRALVHSAPNKVLHVLYDNLHALITEVIRVASRVPRKSLDAAYAEHAGIHALIRDCDPEGARRAMAEHIEASAGYVQIAVATRAGLAGAERARRPSGG